MLKVENLHAKVGDRPILKGLNLSINAGEVHAIMGPNGSGKSTLSKILAGSEEYTVTGGSITLDGQDLLELDPEARAAAGMFLGFQYPVEIPGVSNMVFLKAAFNAQRKTRGEPELQAGDFLAWVRARVKQMKMDPAMLSRGVNEGFSGGEKKRNEILQMLVLEPKLMVLDETDSGLDVDALQIVSDGINAMRSPERATLLVTHYQRLLDHVKPDVVHVLAGGQIIKSGGADLALEIEHKGYGWLLNKAA
ncbi:Fe-S cluster assembly ATPase SufC [Sinimarinibacterium sp. NLF-5-8]|uniref:Fe-S cluster assembly ATPase SufC n=1 Tax=Sinimarinibacterium sp. NLF-5-8 TaxID=2698684 RepID=UPI00137B9937|nr:Fe-S cluster assembly ATPase SufC [Sinimarinibacterium sp. NLF-5-8]QHS11355.1 Fe-S cluster assembly ATPase SufC [Sinimarinibacterium sp. NLF-5-8]